MAEEPQRIRVYRRSNSQQWYYDFRVNGRRVRRPGGRTKAEARQAAEKAISEIVAAVGLPEPSPAARRVKQATVQAIGLAERRPSRGPTLHQVARAYVERLRHAKRAVSADTMEASLAPVIKALGPQRDLANVTTKMVSDWARKELNRPVRLPNGTTRKRAVTTVNRHLRALSAACNWAASRKGGLFDGKLPFYVELLEEPSPRPRALSRREVQALFDAIPNVCAPFNRRRMELVIHLGLLGLRSREILKLETEDVTVQENGRLRLLLRDTKSHTDRPVHVAPADPAFEPILEHLKETRASLEEARDAGFNGSWPFVHAAGRPGRSCKDLNDTVRRLFRAAGLDEFGLGLHTLRRTAATEAASFGLGVGAIKDRFGWRSLQTAARYIDATEDTRGEAADLLAEARRRKAAGEA